MITNKNNVFLDSANSIIGQAYKENDYKKKYDLLLSYKTILNCLNSEISPNFNELLNILETYSNNINLWKSLIGFYVNCSKEHIFEANCGFLDMFENDETIKEQKYDIKTMLKMVMEFYGAFDNDMYKKVINLIKSKDNSIIFTNGLAKSNNKDYSFSGLTVNSSINDNKFVLINNENNFSTYETMVHEFAHAIASYKDNYHYVVAFNPYEEVESLFPEMVSVYEAMINNNSPIYDYYMIRFLDGNIDELNLIYKQWVLLKEWNNNQFNTDKNYFNNLCKYKINEKSFEELCNFDFFESTPYINGMRIVLRLFNIYKQDKKSAIDLYKRIAYGTIKDREDAIREMKYINPVNEIVDVQNKVLEHINKGH